MSCYYNIKYMNIFKLNFKTFLYLVYNEKLNSFSLELTIKI